MSRALHVVDHASENLDADTDGDDEPDKHNLHPAQVHRMASSRRVRPRGYRKAIVCLVLVSSHLLKRYRAVLVVCVAMFRASQISSKHNADACDRGEDSSGKMDRSVWTALLALVFGNRLRVAYTERK